MFGLSSRPIGKGDVITLNTQESVDSLHLDSGSREVTNNVDDSANDWDDSQDEETLPSGSRGRRASVGGWLGETEQEAMNTVTQQFEENKRKSKKKKIKDVKHGRNEVIQFMTQQSIDGDVMEHGLDKDRISNDGSVGSTGDKKKKYKSVFRRALQKIKANKQSNSMDATENDKDSNPTVVSGLPPGIPKLDLDVQLSPPKVATYLLEETGDDLLMQNRRTSNEFYKVRKASMASIGELSPRSTSDVLDEEEGMVAEAILSARARGRRVSMGGWLEESPLTTPDSSRRASLAAGTWMADLQLARNRHLMEEALDKEVQKNKKTRKVKSGWKRAVSSVKKSKKNRKTNIEKLVDHISEEGSLQNSFNISGDAAPQSKDTQNHGRAVLNNLISEPVESGLSPREAHMYGSARKPAASDNESLPSLRMGWIETKDSPISDADGEDPEITPKSKRKKKKSKKDKVKKTNALHRTKSSDFLDDADLKAMRRESSGSDVGLSKSMSAVNTKQKRRLSQVFKKAVSKMSKSKKEGKTSDDNASFGSRSRLGSSRSLQSDVDQEEGQRSPGQDQSQGHKQRHHSAVSAGSSDMLGTSDLEALPSDDEGLFGLSLTPVPHNRHSRTPSPQRHSADLLSPRQAASQAEEQDDRQAYSPRPTSMYGDDDDDDDDDLEENAPGKRESILSDRDSIHSEIPVIQVDDSEVDWTTEGSVFNSRKSSVASKTSSDGGHFEHGESNRFALNARNRPVGQRRISSNSDTAVCLTSDGDLRAPSPDCRASSDTEGAHLVPTGGRRKSWFKRMFSRDSDTGSLSKSQSQVDVNRSGSDAELGIFPTGKPPAKLQPLNATSKKKKKKRSKSAVAVPVEAFKSEEDKEKTRKGEVIEQSAGKEKRLRSKSAGGSLVGSLRPDTDSSRSRSPSVSDADGVFKEDNSGGEPEEDLNASKKKRRFSLRSKKQNDKKFGSALSLNSNKSAASVQDNDNASLTSSQSAKADRKGDSLGKVARLAMALSLWKKKPRKKSVQDQESDVGSCDVDLENEENERAALERDINCDNRGDNARGKRGVQGQPGGSSAADESDSWDSDAEDEEIMRIQSKSPAQSEQDIFCVTKSSGRPSPRNLDSNAKFKDLNEWYKETTADIDKNSGVNGDRENMNFKRKPSVIDEKVRKITEKINRDTSEEYISDGEHGNKEKEDDNGKGSSSIMYKNVIETDESDEDSVEALSIEKSSNVSETEATENETVKEINDTGNLKGQNIQNVIETDESEEEMVENDVAPESKIRNTPSNVIETDESEEEVVKNDNAPATEMHNVIETDSDEDDVYVNKYIPATRNDQNNVESVIDKTEDLNGNAEIDEVDGTIMEAHHVKAVKQCRNCVLCSRLQAELDEAKRKHQEELSTLVAKTKQAANLELSMQRHEFEDKLSELEKALNEQRQANHETEQDKTRAENIIRELEEQRKMLEQEVLSNRKRQEQEAKAAEKMCNQAVLQSRAKHSKVVEQLEKEKQKIRQDVERLEQMRLRRNSPSNTPRITPIKLPHMSELKDSKVKTGLYKTTLLVREANKIAQYLKKDLVFTREDVQEGEDPGQTVIKMTNTKLGISTFWTMDKFEDKLIHMREMFQQGEEVEMMNGEVDEVFCDPNDTWEKDDRVNNSPSISPFLIKGRKRSSMTGVVSKLSYDSERGSKSREDIISESSEMTGSSAMGVCRDLISVALDAFKGSVIQESLSDKVLTRCEVLKRAVHDILDHYNNRDRNSNKTSFVDSDLMQISSIQVAHSVDMLLNLCGLWAAQYEELESGLVQDLCHKILSAVKKLGHNLVLFLQGCENDIETLVKETASQIQDCMIVLCRNCGELSLATATGLVSLRDAQESTAGGQPDTRIKLGHDVRQAFLEGCDVFIDKTLQGSLKTVEECEIRLQGFSDMLDESDGGSMVVVQKVEEVTACCKVFLSKSQQLQVNLDSTMRKSVSHSRSDNFYQRAYTRSQNMVNQVTNLTDAVALLTQATEPLIHGPTDSILRKQARCAEMIQKSVNKLLSTTKSESGHHGNHSGYSDSQSEMSDISLLSEAQMEELDVVSQDAKLAIHSLVNAIKTALDSESDSISSTSQSSTTSGKRILPASPGETNSAISPKNATKQKKMRRSLSLVDMNEVL